MITLYKIVNGGLVPIDRTALAREEPLENWIENDPTIMGLDLLIIGRQVVTDFGGRIDLLAIDREGDLTILELKRDRTPRDVVSQILDYASWIADISDKRIHEIALTYLNEPLPGKFSTRFGTPLPETLNGNHRMVIVASEFDASSKRIVEYLAEKHDISINTAFFTVFEDNGRQLVATDWLMDQEEVTKRSDSKKKAPWTGVWYVNVGDSHHRSWEDMRNYGFISAGAGRVYSARLEQLAVGDRVCAYQKQAGYVGHGTVQSRAQMDTSNNWSLSAVASV